VACVAVERHELHAGTAQKHDASVHAVEGGEGRVVFDFGDAQAPVEGVEACAFGPWAISRVVPAPFFQRCGGRVRRSMCCAPAAVRSCPQHRQVQPLLAGGADREFVAGIGMAHHAAAAVVDEHARQRLAAASVPSATITMPECCE